MLSTVKTYLIFTMIPKRIIFSLYKRHDRLYFPNMAITICLIPRVLLNNVILTLVLLKGSFSFDMPGLVTTAEVILCDFSG